MADQGFSIHKLTSGPLPEPSILQGYEETLPGLANRIVRMAEKEQENRHEIEKTEAGQPFVIAKRGQYFGLASVVISFLFAGLLVILGHPVAGAAIAGIDVVALAAVFVTGQYFSKKRDGSAESS